MFRVDRAHGPVWYAKYRLPDGRQVQKNIGPAWTERGRPPVGSFTKRTAEAWMRDLLDDARRHASIVRTQLLPPFGLMHLETITPETIDAWVARSGGSISSRRKSLVLLHGIFRRARKVYGWRANPIVDVEKPPLQRSGDIEAFSPEEVWALARAAGSDLDAAISLTAAFTGLRMGELLALRWRDVGRWWRPSGQAWRSSTGTGGSGVRAVETAALSPGSRELDEVDATGMRRQVTRAAVIPSPPSGLDDTDRTFPRRRCADPGASAFAA